MPGITVTTGVRVGPTGVDTAPASTLFIVGTAERGPVNAPRQIVSVNQFETIYGGYTSSTTLHDSVKTFFEEGGSRCYVQRVLAGTPTAASYVINDGAGTPDDVMTLRAANPGVWGNSAAGPPAKDGLKVTVTATGSTFSLVVTYKGETIFSGGPYQNEVLADGSTKYGKQFAAEEINGNTYLSNFITAEVGSSTALPLAVTGALFTGGVDGTSVAASDVVANLAKFDYDLGAGAVAAPGWNGTTVWNGLRDHAADNRRIALCAFQPGTTSANAILAADDYWGTDSTSKTKGSYMAFYWPSVKVPDGFGGTRDQSPEAFVAACRARAFRQAGAWRAAAGEIATARYVTGLYEEVSRTTADTLDANRVNAVRTIAGAVRVYGARSVSADETNWRYITYRDTLNYVTSQAEAALEPLVFSPIDGRGNLFGQVEAILTGIMEPIRASGGVYEGFDPNTGDQTDNGYSVVCSSLNNPTALLAAGQVTAEIGARVSPIADQINVTITKSALNATV